MQLEMHALLFSTWTETAVVAGVAAGVSLFVVAASLAVARRLRTERKARVERVSTLVSEFDLRIRKLGDDVAEELERAKEESRRSRHLGELPWSIELEEVIRRTLDMAAALDGVEAALVTALDEGGERMTRGVGLSEDEIRQLELDQRTGSDRVQSLTIAYAQAQLADGGESPPVAISLQVPIEARRRAIGVVSVFARDGLRRFPEETQQALEDLAVRAGPALDNARRYLKARQLADIDPRTGLHNARYFEETLAREVARANRYGRKLALLVFDLDDFKQINDRLGHLAGNAVLKVVAERMREVLRSADVAARYGGDEFAVILPESGVADAARLYERLRGQLTADPIPPLGMVALSCGIGELEAREDWETFFKRVDDALYRAKSKGKNQVEEAVSGVRRISDGVLGTAISEIEPANHAAGSQEEDPEILEAVG